MISAVRAANHILERAAADDVRLTPLQVMKLVYMSHGWHLGSRGAPLIAEGVQAWQYGPVIPSLYQAMKRFGSGPIDPPRLQNLFFDRNEPTEDELASIDQIYNGYSRYSGLALSNLTHRPGSPWSKVWKPGATNLVIPNELIRENYARAKADGVLPAA